MTNDLINREKNLPLKVAADRLVAPSGESKAKMQALTEVLSSEPQVEVPTIHNLHAGVYARTGVIKKGVLAIGMEIRVPTLFIISGKMRLFCGDQTIDVEGYEVFEGEPGRITAGLALEDTVITALFATQAKTVAEAEAEAVGEENVSRLLNGSAKGVISCG